ncbi:hypothetical protein QQ045_029521 [Rhodiola kirilowii]
MVEWLKEGDANTRFFHERASERKRINTITRIKGENGSWVTDEEEICRRAMLFFEDLFRQDGGVLAADWEEALSQINTAIREDYQQLSMPFTATERNWELVKKDVTDFALRFLNEGDLDPAVNETLITLVPKVKSPAEFNDFRPISLVNVAMKVITKAMENRLKGTLMSLISVSQSAFVPGRLISDNILLAYELMHFIKTRQMGSAEYCCIKLDMRKAYDRVDWNFLEAIQLRLGFPVAWVEKVMRCVKSVTYRVKVNDLVSDSFYPERGLRQGDPLSPYLFVLCTEYLTRTLECHQNLGLIRGVKVSRQAPMIR